jgi:hypothetical protein
MKKYEKQVKQYNNKFKQWSKKWILEK